MHLELPKYKEQVEINQQVAYEQQSLRYKLSCKFNTAVNHFLRPTHLFSRRATDIMAISPVLALIAALFGAILQKLG